MSEQTMKAFKVGDYDIYAAYTPEQALELYHEYNGPDDDMSMEFVAEVSDEQMDEEFPDTDEDEAPLAKLRR